MFTAMDLTLAHELREETARRVGEGRTANGPGAGHVGRARRWSSGLARMLRAPSGVSPGTARADGA